MSINTVWDNTAKTIIRKDFIDPWTWEDYAVALEESNAMMATVEHSVGIILNLSTSRQIPENPLHHLRQLVGGGMPANWTTTVIVTNAIFVSALTSIMKSGMGQLLQNIKSVDSLEEARELLAKYPRS